MHDSRITGHQVLDIGDDSRSISVKIGPVGRQLNRVAHSMGRHGGLVGVACNRQAGVIVAQRLFVHARDDVGNNKCHRLVGTPVFSLGKHQIVVVTRVITTGIKRHPVVLKLAGAGISRSPQADFARHGTAVDVVVNQPLRQFA